MKRRHWKEFRYVLFHPYNGFEEIGYKKTGSPWIAGLFILLFFVFTLMERHLLAFRFNNYTVENTNALLVFVSTTLLICVAVVANWGVSTLWDGKANMRTIWIVFGYALCPYVCCILLRSLLSHALIAEEGTFLNILSTLCFAWTALLLWFGMLQTQEFSMGKNLMCLLCTAAGIILILFLCFLVMLLFQELFSFLGSVADELLLRIQ